MAGENNKSGVVRRTTELAKPIAEQVGVTLWDVRFEKEGADWFLRIILDSDREGGISFDQCEAVSRALDPLLDKEDYIPQSYFLEVSSPGLMRPLRRPEHFQASLGMEVRIKLYKAIDGKKELTAVLEDYQDGTMTLLSVDAPRTLSVKDCVWVKRNDELSFE